MREKKPIKVLMVDDDQVQLATVKAWLESQEYHVITHDSPFGTARLVARERPDLLLLDVSMPGLNGHQLADMLRSEGKAPINIIFYSAMDRSSLESLARQYVVLGAIPKTERGAAFLAEFRRLADRAMSRSAASGPSPRS